MAGLLMHHEGARAMVMEAIYYGVFCGFSKIGPIGVVVLCDRSISLSRDCVVLSSRLVAREGPITFNVEGGILPRGILLAYVCSNG